MRYVMGLAGVSILLLAGCGSSSGFHDDPHQPLETIVKNAVHDAVPYSDWTKNKDAFINCTIDSGQVVINADPRGNQGKDTTKFEVLMDTATIIKDLYTDPRVKDVVITWYAPATDKYGNTHADMIATVNISRKTERKINWNGFDSGNIPDVADFFHWGANYA
jgi:hypothetical protein